jgi:hypothetical protein
MLIDYKVVLEGFNTIKGSSIDDSIQSATQPYRLEGMSSEHFRQFLQGYEGVEILIDLLSHGFTIIGDYNDNNRDDMYKIVHVYRANDCNDTY